MSQHSIQVSFIEMPPLVKRLEYVNELRLFKSKQMGYHGVEFIDHVVFSFRNERPAFDIDRRCPLGKSLIRTS